MIIRKLAFAVSLMTASPVTAAEWWYAVTGPNSYTFIDRSSIKKDGNHVTFWEWTFYAAKTGGVASQKAQSQYNCRDRTHSTLYTVTFDENESHLRTFTQPSPSEPIIPESGAEMRLKRVCTEDWSGSGEASDISGEVDGWRKSISR